MHDHTAARHDDPSAAEPAFDPDLPVRVHEELQIRHAELLRADARPLWTTELTPARRRAEALAGAALSVLPAAAVFWAAVQFLLPLTIAAGIAVVALVVLGFGYRAEVGVLALLAAVLLVSVVVWAGAAPTVWALAAGVWGTGACMSVLYALREADHRLPHVFHGRYVVPADLHPEENALLVRVQDAVDVTWTGQEVLGDLFDGDAALRSLREQEWDLARLFVRQSRLALDLEQREREAVSETVLRSLEPQREALERARAEAEERVARVESYGRAVAEAVVKQREWEQIQRNLRRDRAYGELLLDSTATVEADGADPEDPALRAVRESRDESVRRALREVRWLSAANEVAGS